MGEQIRTDTQGITRFAVGSCCLQTGLTALVSQCTAVILFTTDVVGHGDVNLTKERKRAMPSTI